MHDHAAFRWPECKWPNGAKKDENMVFDAKKTMFGSYVLYADGFGNFGRYGNGPISVRNISDIVTA